jgi:DcmR-like sensory protein
LQQNVNFHIAFYAYVPLLRSLGTPATAFVKNALIPSTFLNRSKEQCLTRGYLSVYSIIAVLDYRGAQSSLIVCMFEDPSRLGWPSSFHAVQFYLNDTFLIRSLASFVTDAQKTNGTVIVIATEAHCTMLNNSVQDLDQCKLILADIVELFPQFMRGDRLDKTRFLQLFGEIYQRITPGNRTFVFGEVAPILSSQGLHQAAFMVEQLCGVLCTEYGVSILCGYPHSDYLLSGIYQTHTHLRVGGSMVALT